MVKTLVLALVMVACQGNREAPSGSSASGSEEPPPEREEASTGSSFEPPSDAVAVAEDAGSGAKIEEPEQIDPGKVIAELGAISAWQAVIDRAQLLGRRGQRGVLFGRIGPPIMVVGPTPEVGSIPGAPPSVPPDAGLIASPYVWLIDDTEGNGSLGIRVALAGKDAKLGDRVALGGSWQLDEARRWYWKVESMQPVPPAPPSDLKDPKPPEPNHVVMSGNLAPGGRMISFARDNDIVYFQIVGPPPANDGDGWLVANELGDVPFAMLTLPGERASYGAQDMRAPDERWQLKKAQTYWVRIGKIRTRPDKPALMHARTAPIRIN